MSSEINKALHPSTSSATVAAEMEEPLLPSTSSTATATKMEEPLLPSTSSTSFVAAAVEIEDPLLPSTSFAITATEMEEPLFPSTSAAAAAEMEEPLLPSTSSAGDEIEEVSLSIRNLPSSSSLGSILKNSIIILFIFFVYLSVGVSFYYINPQGFFGVETSGIINGLYFCIVTFCTARL